MTNTLKVSISMRFTSREQALEQLRGELAGLEERILATARQMKEKGMKGIHTQKSHAVITHGTYAGECREHGVIWAGASDEFIDECPDCGAKLIPF